MAVACVRSNGFQQSVGLFRDLSILREHLLHLVTILPAGRQLLAGQSAAIKVVACGDHNLLRTDLVSNRLFVH